MNNLGSLVQTGNSLSSCWVFRTVFATVTKLDILSW